MALRKRLAIAMLVISLGVIISGCGTKTYMANQINPVDKYKINVVKITRSNSSEKEITDKVLIRKIIDDLNNITVKKLTQNEDRKVMDNGNVLKKETTVTVELINSKGGSPQSYVVLFSDSQLYLVDVKSMQRSEYTQSYLSSSDEKTLNAIKDLYSLVNTATN